MLRLNPDVLRLYLVTDQLSLRGRCLIDVVNAAVQGGVSCVQLREKNLGTRDFLAQALLLKKLLVPYGVPLVINDRIDIALACHADGVHLRQSDLPVPDARSLLPPRVFIGLSVESMAQVLLSAKLPVDYLGVSPVFSTPTKTDTKTAWELEGVVAVHAATCLPLVGIRGIHADNAVAILRAGADGLAVVSALCSAQDPRAAAAQLKSLCDEELKARRKSYD